MGWLISYGGGSDGDNGVRGGRVGKDCSWAERTDSALGSVSDLYSNSEISVGDSRPFSCPAYTIYWLLIFFLTNYCPKKCLTNIPKKGMPTLDRTHRRPHCSSAWMGYKGALQHKASTWKTTYQHPQKVLHSPTPVGFDINKWLGFLLLVGILL